MILLYNSIQIQIELSPFASLPFPNLSFYTSNLATFLPTLLHDHHEPNDVDCGEPSQYRVISKVVILVWVTLKAAFVACLEAKMN